MSQARQKMEAIIAGCSLPKLKKLAELAVQKPEMEARVVEGLIWRELERRMSKKAFVAYMAKLEEMV